jgi:hypothetical protein
MGSLFAGEDALRNPEAHPENGWGPFYAVMAASQSHGRAAKDQDPRTAPTVHIWSTAARFKSESYSRYSAIIIRRWLTTTIDLSRPDG